MTVEYIFFASHDITQTSQCVECASLLVSANAVICYSASMANLILFTDEKCLLCQHWATWGHKIRRLTIQKCNQFASSVC